MGYTEGLVWVIGATTFVGTLMSHQTGLAFVVLAVWFGLVPLARWTDRRRAKRQAARELGHLGENRR